MTIKTFLPSVAVCSALMFGPALFAQQPTQSVNPNTHPILAAAQHSIGHAYQKVEEAKRAHHEHLGGHGERAKELLRDASQQLAMAAAYSDQHRH